MSDEKRIDLEAFGGLAELLEARLRRGQAGGSGRPGGFVLTPPAVSPAPETWQDGSPRDREAWLLQRGVAGEPFDEERFSTDDSYSSREDVQRAAAQLVEARRQKAQGKPHPEIVTQGPDQATYEKDREKLLYAEKRAAIAAQIAELQSRFDALEAGED
jgi:hypothetical protein